MKFVNIETFDACKFKTSFKNYDKITEAASNKNNLTNIIKY